MRCRPRTESLLDDIARNVRPQEAAQLLSSENRRALLADAGFLVADRNEWTCDGKNYLSGLFKMLHTQGSHPGLSDEDHSTFWVVVSAGRCGPVADHTGRRASHRRSVV